MTIVVVKLNHLTLTCSFGSVAHVSICQSIVLVQISPTNLASLIFGDKVRLNHLHELRS